MNYQSVKLYYKYSTHLINVTIHTKVCLALIYKNKFSFPVSRKDKPCLVKSIKSLTQTDLKANAKTSLYTQLQVQPACNKIFNKFKHKMNTTA